MTVKSSVQEVSFNEQQEKKLEEVFELFRELSGKIQSIATAVQLSSIAESHTDLKLNDFQLETLMKSIINDSNVIHSECCELSVNPNALFYNYDEV